MNKKNCPVCRTKLKKRFNKGKYGYFQCVDCGLVTTYPIPSIKEIRKHYKKKFRSGNYEQLLKNRDLYKSVYLQFAEMIQNYLSEQGMEKKGMKVLDVGCFTGDFLILMEERGFSGYGTELQPEAVKIANKSLNGRVKKAETLKELNDSSEYDIISLQGLIEHVVQPIELVKDGHKMLKENGIIFIQTPNTNSLFQKILREYWPPYAPIEHIYLFSEESISKLLKDAGFTEIKVKKHIKWLPVNYVYRNFQNFGPHFYKLLKPLGPLIEKMKFKLPFYVGEMMVIAKKK